jgi:hypothetical protein
MNQKMANKTERIQFEQLIQNDKLGRRNDNRKNFEDNSKTVRFVDQQQTPLITNINKPKPMPQSTTSKLTKRDMIWEDKRKKKFNGIDSKIIINANSVNNYMNNLHNQVSTQTYNVGTPLPNNYPSTNHISHTPKMDSQQFQMNSNTNINSNRTPNVSIPQQSSRSTPFTYLNRFPQNQIVDQYASSGSLPHMNMHIVQGGIQNYNYQNKSPMPTPYNNQKAFTPHALGNQYYDNPNAIVNNNFNYPKTSVPQYYSNTVTPDGTNRQTQKPFQNITFGRQTPYAVNSNQELYQNTGGRY